MTVAHWAERELRRHANCMTRLPRRALGAAASVADNAVASVPEAILTAQKVRKFIAHRVEDVIVNINHVSLLASSMLPENFYDPWDWEPESFEDWS